MYDERRRFGGPWMAAVGTVRLRRGQPIGIGAHVEVVEEGCGLFLAEALDKVMNDFLHRHTGIVHRVQMGDAGGRGV